jgi:hypothetical protein
MVLKSTIFGPFWPKRSEIGPKYLLNWTIWQHCKKTALKSISFLLLASRLFNPWRRHNRELPGITPLIITMAVAEVVAKQLTAVASLNNSVQHVILLWLYIHDYYFQKQHCLAHKFLSNYNGSSHIL